MQFNTSFHLTHEGLTGTFLSEDPKNYITQQNANSFPNTTLHSRPISTEEHEILGQTSLYQWNDKNSQPQDDFTNDAFAITRNKCDNFSYVPSLQPNNYPNDYTEDIAISHNRNPESLAQFNYSTDGKYIGNNGSKFESHMTTMLQSEYQAVKIGDINGVDSYKNYAYNYVPENESFEKQMLKTAKIYSGYPLSRVALMIENLDKEIERLKKSEKSKELKNLQLERKKHQHLFALVLLFQTFKISPDAVCPRNIVYLKYAEACKANRLQPICNAAFGKLVKVFNPNIKTRRLGMRGCSKYNYCGIELISQDDALMESFNDTKKDGKSSSTKLNMKEDSNPVLGRTTSIDLPDFRFHVSSDKLSPPSLSISTDTMGNTYMEIFEKFFEYGMQAINELKLWNLESFVYKLKTFDFGVLLNKELFKTFKSEFENDRLILKLTEIYIYLCMNALEVIYNTVLFKPHPSIAENLDYLKKNFIDYFKTLNLKNRISRDQYNIGQRFLNIIIRIKKTFMLCYSFIQCFKNELDVNLFLNNYASIDYRTILSQTGFDELMQNEYSSFLKDMRLCISCICFESYDQTPCELLSLGKASMHLSHHIERLANNLSYMAPSDLIYQLNTVGILLLQDVSIGFPAEQHQKWLYFIGWMNSYFTLKGQLGSFNIQPNR